MSDAPSDAMPRTAENAPAELQSAVRGGVWTFGLVAAGQFVSLFGSSLSAFAMGIWAYDQTGSATLLSMIILAASLPGILVTPLAGSVVDRYDRRLVMLLSDSTAGFTTLLIAALFFTGHFAIGWIFALAVVSSLANAFQEPAYTASIPLLVPKRHLGRASGVVQLSQGVARIATPLLAAAALKNQGMGLGLLLGIDFATFLVAVSTLALVRFPRPLASEEGSLGRGSLWREAAAGWGYLRRRRGLVGLLCLFASLNFLVSMVNVLYIPLVMTFASKEAMAAALTVGGMGMLVGSILVTILGTPQRKVRSLLGLIFLGGVAIGLTGAVASVPYIAVCGFGMMMVLPILLSTYQVLWQTKVTPDVQGRVFALRRVSVQATIPAGQLAAGPLADFVFEPLLVSGGVLSGTIGAWIGTGPGRGIGLMFIVMGLGGCLLAILGVLHPRIRRIEQEIPDAVADIPAT